MFFHLTTITSILYPRLFHLTTKISITDQVAHSRKEPATALQVAFGGERQENYRSVALETIFYLSKASLKSFSEAEIIFSEAASATSSFLLLFYLVTPNFVSLRSIIVESCGKKKVKETRIFK